METQEIPEAQEPQKTQEPTEGSKTEGQQQKVKNPVRVAAGKKGAEARWSKGNQAQAQHAQQAQPEPIRITKESPEQPPPRPPVTVNVYKNFFPLCMLIGAAGIGIFLICRKAEMQPKMQPEIQPEIKQRLTDPFEMR